MRDDWVTLGLKPTVAGGPSPCDIRVPPDVAEYLLAGEHPATGPITEPVDMVPLMHPHEGEASPS